MVTQAVADSTTAFEKNNENQKALLRRAQAQLQLGDFSEALRDVFKLGVLDNDLENSKDNDRLKQKILSEVFARPEVEGDAGDMLKNIMVELRFQGNQSISQDEPEDAVEHYSAGIWIAQRCQFAPKDLTSVLYANRAFANIRLRRWSDCVFDCTRALSIDPTSQKAKYRRALARFHLGHHEQAYQDLMQFFNTLSSDVCHTDAVELMIQIAQQMPELTPWDES